MKKLFISLPFIAFCGPSFAADAVVDNPQPVMMAEPTSNWSGFYVGVQAGGAFGTDDGIFSMDRNGDGRFGDFLPAFGDNFSGSFNSGFSGGIHAGYDHQIGNFVVGGIVDINFTDIGDEQSGFSSTPAFYTIKRDLDYLITLRAKLGYAFSDRFMGYATGGLAYGDVDYSFSSNTPAMTSTSGGSDSDIGYTVGAGLDTKITEKITIGFEYLYTNLGDNDYTVNLSGPGAFSGPGSAGSTNARGSDSDFDFHTVQVKMSYRF